MHVHVGGREMEGECDRGREKERGRKRKTINGQVGDKKGDKIR